MPTITTAEFGALAFRAGRKGCLTTRSGNWDTAALDGEGTVRPHTPHQRTPTHVRALVGFHLSRSCRPRVLTNGHDCPGEPKGAVVMVSVADGLLTSMLSSQVCRLLTASCPRARFQITTYKALSVKKHWLTVDMLAGPPMSHTLNVTESFWRGRKQRV